MCYFFVICSFYEIYFQKWNSVLIFAKSNHSIKKALNSKDEKCWFDFLINNKYLGIISMKNLILIRHAKSSWEAPLHDKERPLTHKGMKDAHLVSAVIDEFIPKTYIIWSSSAKRASDTAFIFAQNMSYPY